MDLKDIKKIIEMMKANELSEFELEEEGFRISVRRRGDGEPSIMVPGPGSHMVMTPQAPMPPAAPPGAGAPQEAAPPEEENVVDVISPIVGTFYRAAAPDAEPFVTVGQEVDEETVVCIIEAMKVMNEIKAETRGIVRKVLVENATPVEFGQVLLKIEPM